MRQAVALCPLFVAMLCGAMVMPAAAQEGGEEMPEYMMPSEAHKVLTDLAGTWDVASRFWMDPTQPPMESKGEATFTAILEGRYVTQEYESEMMGQPFRGFGMDGYDVLAKKYVSVWTDTMGTAIYSMSGTREGNVLTMEGQWPSPEGTHTMRSVITHQDAEHFTMEMFMQAGEDWVQLMELKYTRRAE